MLQPIWYPACRDAWGRGMIFLWGFWLLLAIAVAWVILQRLRASRTPDPIEIVKGRYARGEIDAATYQRMLDDLRRPAAPEEREE